MLFIQENSTRARQILLVFKIMIVLNILNIFSLFWQYTLLQGVLKDPGNIDLPTLELNDTVQRSIAIASIIVFIFAIIYFIRWFRRAYNNLHAVPSVNPLFSEGWAAGAWFVPFLNLVRPYQIMKEIWEKTQQAVTYRLGNEKPSTLVGVWWAGYLVMNIYNNIASRLYLQAEGVDELLTATTLGIIGEFIATPVVVLAMIMIRRTNEFEQALYQEAQEPSDSVFSLTTTDDQPTNP